MNAKNVEKLATGLSRPLLRGFSNYHHMGQVAFVFVIHFKPIFQTHRHLIDNDDLTPGFSLKEFSPSPCLPCPESDSLSAALPVSSARPL